MREAYQLRLDRSIKLVNDKDLQAHIIRSTGYHTDGFSLGSLLYDLASGGKNPEYFFIYCLANFTSRFSKLFEMADYRIEDVVDILYPHDPLESATSANHSGIHIREKLRIGREVLVAQNVDRLIDSILEISLNAAGTADGKEGLKNYRYRHFHLVNDLLSDYRGVPIPKGILDVIVRCMLRDIPGSYYYCDEVFGFLSEENQRGSEKIHRDVQRLLSQPQYRLPATFPQPLQTNVLFKLRAFTT
jgi:hypothetical protein